MEVIGLRFPNTGQDSVLNERCRPVTGTLKTDAVIRRGPLNFRPITIITTTIIKIILIITIIVTATIIIICVISRPARGALAYTEHRHSKSFDVSILTRSMDGKNQRFSIC